MTDREFQQAREEMVRNHLVSRGITSSLVLDVFRTVPREKFVPPAVQTDAYGDFPLPIGSGQTISQPYIVALMMDSVSLRKGGRVLEIGTGSGYQTALLAETGAFVYSVERIPDLAQQAEKILRELGYRSVAIKTGDGTLGWPENKPYDAVLVSAAAEKTPKALIDQLAENGKLIIPVGSRSEQELVLYHKTAQGISTHYLGGCRFVPLVGQEGWDEET